MGGRGVVIYCFTGASRLSGHPDGGVWMEFCGVSVFFLLRVYLSLLGVIGYEFLIRATGHFLGGNCSNILIRADGWPVALLLLATSVVC